MSIQQLVMQALSARQLSSLAEWRISQLLSNRQHTPADLNALNRLMDALECGEVTVTYSEQIAS
ncbi:hypothetical protein [Leptolyngbya sp. FACHB-261]|uniref:hypothetical protein n=1 Tax=Leptolyngbya sp. FACHB-261 TaxID=2692806 RepID=UPI001686D781|nr:hypothetical protein [Leptolyngbya sp. FACHB-261]MBD2102724.1 hypothetical protein [Leptolyngbya sp. FACHB-261]